MPAKSKPKVRKFKIKKEKSVKKAKPAKKVDTKKEVEEKIEEQPNIDPSVVSVEQPSTQESLNSVQPTPSENVTSVSQEVQPLQPVSTEVQPESSSPLEEKPAEESQPDVTLGTAAEGVEVSTANGAQKPLDANVTNPINPVEATDAINKEQPQSIAGTNTEAPTTTPPWHLELDGVESGNKWFNKKTVTIIVVVVFFLALGGIGFMSRSKIKKLFNKTDNSQSASIAVNKQPRPTATPTEEPVKLSEYKIKVLNGSGITGAAGKVKTLLEDGGFTITSAGNADKSDYTETVIQASKEVKSNYLDQLKELIGKTYVVSSTFETLDSSGSADVIVIVGSKKAE